MQKLSKTDTYRSKSKCLFRFELQFNSNRIDWRSFCKLWRQWTSCSMTVLLGTRAGLHVEVLHKAKRLVALRLWVPLESSACFVCHAFPCAKMCHTAEAFWAFAFFIYDASPYCIEYETSILQAAHQQQLQVHFLSGILKHWQIKSLIDLRSSDSKNVNIISYPFNFWQVKQSQACCYTVVRFLGLRTNTSTSDIK